MRHFKLKKILIIKHGSLGDIISATSVLKDIRDNYNKQAIVSLLPNYLEIRFLHQVLPIDIILLQ